MQRINLKNNNNYDSKEIKDYINIKREEQQENK